MNSLPGIRWLQLGKAGPRYKPATELGEIIFPARLFKGDRVYFERIPQLFLALGDNCKARGNVNGRHAAREILDGWIGVRITDEQGRVGIEHATEKIPRPAFDHIGASEILIAQHQRVSFTQKRAMQMDDAAKFVPQREGGGEKLVTPYVLFSENRGEMGVEVRGNDPDIFSAGK